MTRYTVTKKMHIPYLTPRDQGEFRIEPEDGFEVHMEGNDAWLVPASPRSTAILEDFPHKDKQGRVWINMANGFLLRLGFLTLIDTCQNQPPPSPENPQE